VLFYRFWFGLADACIIVITLFGWSIGPARSMIALPSKKVLLMMMMIRFDSGGASAFE